MSDHQQVGATLSFLAFVFPGQGSQSVGMLSEFADDLVFQETFATASDALGFDLWRMAAEGPEGELNQTKNTQPVLLSASIALWRLWLSQGGPRPAVMAGHSLGEYSALVAADALDLSDALRLVRRRGELMQQAVAADTGAMAAILGLDDEAVIACCREAAQATGAVVSGANFNAKGQVVVAGTTKAVDHAINLCRDAGARKAIRLSVSVPSHCALMQPAADRFAQDLAQVSLATPTIPIAQNMNAQISSDIDKIRQGLLAQLVSPVLWSGCVDTLHNMGVTNLLECGPGNVLTTLTKRINKSLMADTLSKRARFLSALEDANAG